jgi:hypothetical protein
MTGAFEWNVLVSKRKYEKKGKCSLELSAELEPSLLYSTWWLGILGLERDVDRQAWLYIYEKPAGQISHLVSTDRTPRMCAKEDLNWHLGNRARCKLPATITSYSHPYWITHEAGQFGEEW